MVENSENNDNMKETIENGKPKEIGFLADFL